MNKKRRGGPAPVPPDNRPQLIPDEALELDDVCPDGEAGAEFNDQDTQRRLGNFGGAGEHPRQHYGFPNKGNQAK